MAQKELAALPKAIRDRLVAKIQSLSTTPRPSGCKALQGKVWQGCTRIRSGDYRIIYQIHDGRLIVAIIEVGNRRDIYDDR